jgi:nicotinamidase-related amidase
MASLPIRDPVGDHLLTPQNSALVVIDYQPSQFAAVGSMDRDLLRENIVSTAKTAKAFRMPIDRTSTNAWEDAEFLAAVTAVAEPPRASPYLKGTVTGPGSRR